MKVLFVWPNKDSFGYKPMGLSLLSGIAKRLGWETKLFDTTEIDFGYTDNTTAGEKATVYKPVDFSNYNFKKKKINLELAFLKVLKKFSPDCLAISVLSDEFLIARRISEAAKKCFPQLPIIWGGKFPTLNPRVTLEKYNADFICISEGLEAFADFLEGLMGRKDLYKIANIWSKRGNDVIVNEIRPLKQDLDELPYADWEIFDRRHFYKPFDGRIYIGGDHMLNWGCVYHCSYCINDFYHNLYKNKYVLRRYSAKRIIKEIKFIKEKYNIEFIKFHDEDFLMRPLEDFKELSKIYREEVNIPFVIETNPKTVTEEKVKLLKRMNCVSVSMGIETGDEYLRKNILKRVDSEADIIKAFSLFREAGIRTSSFNMLGIPFETRQTYEKSIELNRKSMVQYPDINFFYPFEGTELRKISVEKGFFNPSDIERFIYKRDFPALSFDNLSDGELQEMRNVFVLYVKLPKSYLPYIRRSELQDEVGKKLRKKLLEIYNKTVWENDGWFKDDGSQDIYLSELRKIMQTAKNKDKSENNKAYEYSDY